MLTYRKGDCEWSGSRPGTRHTVLLLYIKDDCPARFFCDVNLSFPGFVYTVRNG